MGIDETLTQAFALMLVSFSYSEKKHITFSPINHFLYTYIYRAYYNTFKIFVQNTLFSLYIIYLKRHFTAEYQGVDC